MSLLSILDHVKQAVASPFESKPQAQAAGVSSLDTSSSGTGTGTTDPTNTATITANDFLTLLVTEIQNQDPTQQTDPMQYITQLVGVNSLEQLVQINQTLTGGTGTTPSSNAATSSPSSNADGATAVAPKVQPAATTAPMSAVGSLMPPGSNTQLPSAAETAVAHAFTQSSALPTQVVPRAQVLPPTQVPLNPEVMRALEHSIPGATYSGQPSLPASVSAGTGGAGR